jgi:hypothetical protein
MVKVKEQALIEKLVAHAPVEALTEAVLHRLSWRNECQTIWLSRAQASLALAVNSVSLSDTIMPSFPRHRTSIVNSRAPRRPEIEVSGIAAKPSRVTSSDDVQDEEPSAADELVMDKIQRPAGVGSRLDQDRRPRPCCAPPGSPLALRQALFVIEAVDPVDPGRFAVLPQQDEQAPIAETPLGVGADRAIASEVPCPARVVNNSRSSCDPHRQGSKAAAPTGPYGLTMRNAFVLDGGPYHFLARSSRSAAASNIGSAKSFFSLAFSSSS